MSASPDPVADRRWMRQALALAALGEGTTSPNPRVGCVLVREGRVVGHGHHTAPGRPHAEACALERAGARARGATVYVNLEPCAHHGRTPPCVDALVDRGVRRVVASVVDPNPLVDGRGFRRLREAGIEVEVGMLEQEARDLNRPFFHWHETARPLVTVKAAVTLDGLLSAAEGRARWITGEPARRFSHRLRLAHDAVLVGAETVRRDDPQLTVRLSGVNAPRLRAVLSPVLSVDPQSRVFRTSESHRRTRVYAGAGAPAEREARLAGRADVVRLPLDAEGRLPLAEVLSDLAACDVQSVLVEGGGRTVAGFLAAGLVDRAALFVAPAMLGARGATPLVDRASVTEPARGWRVAVERRIALGDDLLLIGAVRAGG